MIDADYEQWAVGLPFEEIAKVLRERDDLLAENKRLRAALSKCHNRAHNPQEVKQIVREALQGVDNA